LHKRLHIVLGNSTRLHKAVTYPAQSPAQSYKLEDCLPAISISGEGCLLDNCSSTVPSTVL